MGERVEDTPAGGASGQEPRCDDSRCSLCGLCVQSCTSGALALGSERPYLARPDLCRGCGICEEVCPAGAITCDFEIVWDSGQEPATSTLGAQSADEAPKGGKDA